MARFGCAAFLALAFGASACGSGWGDGQRIEAGVPDPTRFFYFSPKVAAAGSVFGSATAVWTSSLSELHASNLGGSWSAPTAFTDHRQYRHAHAVAVGAGTAIALFTTSTGLSWARLAGGTWGPAASLGETGRWPGIAADRDGNMVAVWTTGTRIRSARYLMASGWEPTESLGAEVASATSPDVAVSASGHAVAAWCERRADDTSWVVVNRYVPGAGWAGATDLGSVPECLVVRGGWAEFAPDPSTVEVAIDELNVSGVVRTNGTVQFQRYARRFDGTSAWTAPRALSTGVDAIHPQIAVNRDGDAIVAWQTFDTNEVQGGRYSAEFDLWSGTRTLAPSTPRPPNLAVGIDSAQHGMVAYLDDRQRVTAIGYDGARFGSAQAISDIGSYEFDMVMTADGQACAVWASRQIDVFASVFTP